MYLPGPVLYQPRFHPPPRGGSGVDRDADGHLAPAALRVSSVAHFGKTRLRGVAPPCSLGLSTADIS